MLFAIDSTYLWLALAIGLGVLELSTATLVCIWFVAGSLLAFAASFITDSFIVQLVVFILSSGILLAATRPLVKKLIGKEPVPTNADMYIGTICHVTQDILPDKKGRVKVGDVSWLARADRYIPEGSLVRIEKITGATLTVTPVNQTVSQ